MNFLSAIRVSLDALLVNKGRSTLTSLGIVIGISAVIAMVSAGQGARQKLEDRLESVGKNLIIVRPGARTQSGTTGDFAPLTRDDGEALRKELGGAVRGVCPEQVTQRVLIKGARHWFTVFCGVVPELQPVRNMVMTACRIHVDDD